MHDSMTDAKTKQEWQEKRAFLPEGFEEKTLAWIRSENGTVERVREHALLEYHIVSVGADPYLCPRTSVRLSPKA